MKEWVIWKERERKEQALTARLRFQASAQYPGGAESCL